MQGGIVCTMSEDISGLSKTKQNAINAYRKGYRIVDGKCVQPNGTIMLGHLRNKQYLNYAKPHFQGHHLAAFQKFGMEWALSGLHVRHMDAVKTNNNLENIEIGTHLQNMQDIDIPTRLKRANNTLLKRNRKIGIAEKLRKLDPLIVLNIRKDYFINKLRIADISQKYNIHRGKFSVLLQFSTYVEAVDQELIDAVKSSQNDHLIPGVRAEVSNEEVINIRKDYHAGYTSQQLQEKYKLSCQKLYQLTRKISHKYI